MMQGRDNMPIQYADKPYQPSEKPILSIKFTPGRAIRAGDSVSGVPTLIVYRMSDRMDVTSDVTGPPAVAGILQDDPIPALVSNEVFFKLGDWVDGEDYAVEITYDTTNGEEDMNEVLVIECRELP
jgi:hypothetical protein